jgi:hypothetical protein
VIAVVDARVAITRYEIAADGFCSGGGVSLSE